MLIRAAFFIVTLSLLALPSAAQVVDYDVVYVRQPRFGDQTNTTWPEVFHPAWADPGADLVLLHPDGTEEVLVDCEVCSVTDPFISFDGQWVYYSLFHDLTRLNYQRRDLPLDGADIFRLRLADGLIERLTHGEFTPNTGAGNWDESNPLDPPGEFNRLGYGILNLGPCPLAGGRIVFTSNRGGLTPPKSFTSPTLQLYVMDEDGSNVTPIAPMSINSALHPTPLRDGRIMFSSYESQGLRDRRLWGIWTLYPDGREWAPLVSAFKSPSAFHFMTQLSDQDLVVVDYYNLNNNGFGALYRFPVAPPDGTPAFGSPFPSQNPAVDQTVGGGFLWPFQMSFTPYGMYSLSPMTHGEDHAAPVGGDGATRVGKFTHPSAAPGGDLLVVWTPGPANDLNRPTPLPYYDSGLYLMPDASPIWSPDELVLLKNDPAYNEAWPRAVVPYREVHGVEQPVELPWLPNDGTLHPELPPGTPYGLIGTSSFFKRESFPGRGSSAFDGLDPFNTSENGASSNWAYQGSDAGRYDDGDIWAVRLVALEPNSHRSYGPNSGIHFRNFANERHRILGEIPLRKVDDEGNTVVDPEGHPDTSFLAKIPADTPFTFQTIDRNGMVLNMAQTWHQVRPGEVRTNCGGCHAHSLQPLDFSLTAAARPDYPVFDLSKVTPLVTHDAEGSPSLDVVDAPLADVEFHRDIRPILERSCIASCHTKNKANPDGNLVFDDRTLYDGLPGDYKRLADDRDADFGYPPIITFGPVWRQTNASRYVRMFQSRRSLLMWKIFGQRLDGWSNADHPTESIPGDASTLPPGAHPNEADLDFTGSIMPPPGSGVSGSGVPALTADEKMTFARWIDLGCPIDTAEGEPDDAFGWFLDDLKPTVTVSVPRPGLNADPITVLRFGLVDANSGIDIASLSVSADFPVAGRAAGAQLADLAVQVADGVYEIGLGTALGTDMVSRVWVSVSDRQGNITHVDRRFSTGQGAVFSDGFESGDTANWSARATGAPRHR